MSASLAQPEISAIVCTRNRAAPLSRCLRAFAGIHTARPWELILVDNGSTDGTARVIDSFRLESLMPVKTVAVPRPGLARARNAGVREARGAIVAFTDDDCYPEPDWLERVWEAFNRDAGIGAVAGRVELYDRADAEFTIRTDARAQRISAGSFVWPGWVQGANMAVRRELFATVGYFDVRLGAGTAFPVEDIDFVARVLQAGFSAVYEPAALVKHHHGRRPGQALEELKRAYAKGRGAYYAKGLARSATRRLYARHLYWRYLNPAYRNDWRTRSLEWRGALSWWGQSVWGGGGGET